jgi:hypothetical protein
LDALAARGYEAVSREKPMNRDDQIRARCNDFHQRHPEVWDRFVEIALELIRRGHKRYGAQTIFAIMRWEGSLGDDGVTAFKLNNDFAARYARRFQRVYRENADFFATRRQRSKDTPACDLPALTPADFD